MLESEFGSRLTTTLCYSQKAKELNLSKLG